MRAKYEKSPRSLAGRFWRWHINFCPDRIYRSLLFGTRAYAHTLLGTFCSAQPQEIARVRKTAQLLNNTTHTNRK